MKSETSIGAQYHMHKIDPVGVRFAFNMERRQPHTLYKLRVRGVDLLVMEKKPNGSLYITVKEQGLLPSGRAVAPSACRYTITPENAVKSTGI
jgi:hypothetical protein